MPRPYLLAVILFVFPVPSALQATAQISLDPHAAAKAYVMYTDEAQTIAANKPATLELLFQVLSGYHINSHTPGSDFLIPTVVTLAPAAGIKTRDPHYPSGTPYSFDFDPGTKLDVYAGEFIIRLPVVASAGEHTLEGTLKYQACDNASCYPPRTVPLKLLFNAK